MLCNLIARDVHSFLISYKQYPLDILLDGPVVVETVGVDGVPESGVPWVQNKIKMKYKTP